MGKQGRTIHDLRAELALTREEGSRVERGDLRRQDREIESLKETNARQAKLIQSLREKLAEKGVEDPEGDAYTGLKGNHPLADEPPGTVVAW